jgi:D-ribose pyranase
MLRSGILHVELARFLASCGHLDEIVICDAGLPIPDESQRIELAIGPGLPGLLPVLDLVLGSIVVEAAVMADEGLVRSPQMSADVPRRLPGIPMSRLPHVDFKRRTRSAKGILRTGEFTPYSNVILVCGCAY